MVDLGACSNIESVDEVVTEMEHIIQTMQERLRRIYNSITFKECQPG